jgi:hypothetical protein
MIMKKYKVIFHTCIHDSQDYGSDDEHMVSRVFFDLEIDGEIFKDLFADLKQAVGRDIETGIIEVGPPKGYSGSFNHIAFRDAAEKYYRTLVGSPGRVIHIEGGSNIHMRNTTLIQEMIFEFELNS